uniref:Uncharacterized protein n=1 Tax=Sipha flava TaxID=143950 RepID=A0A2S2R433_9HEMI
MVFLCCTDIIIREESWQKWTARGWCTNSSTFLRTLSRSIVPVHEKKNDDNITYVLITILSSSLIYILVHRYMAYAHKCIKICIRYVVCVCVCVCLCVLLCTIRI